MRGGAGVIAAMVAVLAGALVFVFVEFRGGKDGERSVQLGVPRAEAACSDEAPRCIPRLTMMDTRGNVWTPESLAGKVVVVNVWATWCRPCAAEIPDLIAFNDRYADKGVVLLGLLNDSVKDEALETFARNFAIDYPIIPMDDDLYRAFDAPDKLPITFVYDKSGHLRFGEPGALNQAELAHIVDPLLAE